MRCTWFVWINVNVGPSVRLFDTWEKIICRPNYTLRVSRFRLLKLDFLPAYACPPSGIIRPGDLRDNRGVLMLRFQLPDYPDPDMFPGCSTLGTRLRRFNLKAFPSLKSLFFKKIGVSPIRYHPASCRCGTRPRPACAAPSTTRACFGTSPSV